MKANKPIAVDFVTNEELQCERSSVKSLNWPINCEKSAYSTLPHHFECTFNLCIAISEIIATGRPVHVHTQKTVPIALVLVYDLIRLV